MLLACSVLLLVMSGISANSLAAALAQLSALVTGNNEVETALTLVQNAAS